MIRARNLPLDISRPVAAEAKSVSRQCQQVQFGGHSRGVAPEESVGRKPRRFSVNAEFANAETRCEAAPRRFSRGISGLEEGQVLDRVHGRSHASPARNRRSGWLCRRCIAFRVPLLLRNSGCGHQRSYAAKSFLGLRERPVTGNGKPV